MKIAVLNTQVPFVRGGAEALADSLAERLRGRGHTVEQVNIPAQTDPPESVLRHMLAFRSMRLEADLAIPLKFPAYMIPCAAKRLWLLHQFRQVYDLWNTEFSGMVDGPESRALRDAVKAADAECLGGAERIHTISHIISGRLLEHNGIRADGVLYPPLPRPELFLPGPRGDYAFYPSRLSPPKRQHIAVEAMRYVRTPIRLVIAGTANPAEYGTRLHRMVEEYGLGGKVVFEGWITEERKAELMSRALCAVFLPYDEDCYGYVTLEAFHSHKPMVTFQDSGGLLEIVEEGRNGLVTDPNPRDLAAALDRLWEDRALCDAMGEDGGATIDRHRIHWDHVLDTLTA